MGEQVTPQTVGTAFQRWRRVADAMTFRRAWPWQMRVDISPAPSDPGIEVRVALLAPDIATGERQWVHMIDVVPGGWETSTDADIARCIRALLEGLVAHEFDECLLLGGEQMRDPHAPERTKARLDRRMAA